MTDIFDELTKLMVGFDQMGNRLHHSHRKGYPPHNIIRYGNEGNYHYEIEIAVSGFSKDDIDITQEGNELKVSGSPSQEVATPHIYLHRGLSRSSFTRTFILNEHMEVGTPFIENGVLTIPVEVAAPKSNAKRIEISSGPEELTPEVGTSKVTVA